jgi:hypothetical protein
MWWRMRVFVVVPISTAASLRFCHVFVSEFLCVVVQRISRIQFGNAVRWRRVHLSHIAVAFTVVFAKFGIIRRDVHSHEDAQFEAPRFLEMTIKNYIPTIHKDTVANTHRRLGASNLLHVAESFLRGLHVFSVSRNSLVFMEPEGSLPH